MNWIPLALTSLAIAAVPARDDDDALPAPVDFASQVRPILAEHCFACHGPDEAVREAELRLDLEAEVLADRGGYAAVVGGELEASELWMRVTDVDDPMPPTEHGRMLDASELELLRRWIEAGAEWSQHWAFEAPQSAEAPDVGDESWPRAALDRFVLLRMQAAGLTPSPEAQRSALLRRASFDLTGLPPSPEELDEFLNDLRPEAYERAVERLLESPRFGERQAQEWLDLARFADTNGDGYDGTRDMSRWRAWVIDAFNENKPFDEFTLEQLAGDLLPNGTRDQELATGFLRLHTIFTKPGAEKDEYRHAYVVDRVNTTAEVWLGLTMGCAQCHDHKYDPVSQRDYYALYAFFNNASEGDVGSGRSNTWPTMVLPEEEEDAARIDELRAEATPLRDELEDDDAELDAQQIAWEEAALERLGPEVEWSPLDPVGMLALGGTEFERLEDGSILARGASPAEDTYHFVLRPGKIDITALRLEVLPHESMPEGGSGRSENGTFNLNELTVNLTSVLNGDGGQSVRFLRGEDDLGPDRSGDADEAVDGSERSGWSIDEDEVGEPHSAIFLPAETLELNDKSILRVEFDQSFRRRYRNTLGRFRLSYTDDERLLRRRIPVLASGWHSLGPFPAKEMEEAHATEFEPEADIAGGVDLSKRYTRIELEEEPRGRGGRRGGGPGGGERAARPAGAEPPSRAEAGAPSGVEAGAAESGNGAGGPGGGGPGKPGSDASGAPTAGQPATPSAGAPAATPDGEGQPATPAEPPAFDPENFDPENFDFANFDPTMFGGGGGGGRGRGQRDDDKIGWEEQEDWRDGGSIRLSGNESAFYLRRSLDADQTRSLRLSYEGVLALKLWNGGELVHAREPAEIPQRRRTPKLEPSAPEDEDDGGGFGRFFDREPDYEWVDLVLAEGENELVLKITTGERGGSVRFQLQPLGEDVLSYAAERALYARAAERTARAAAEGLSAAPSGSDEGLSPVALVDADAREEESTPSAAVLRRDARMREWYRRWTSDDARERYDHLLRLEQELGRLEGPLPTSMVMDEMRPRTTRVLLRGVWNQHGEEVTPDVPQSLPRMAEGAPRDRLGLAQWLIADDNPLTARVAVNRIWRQYFGSGLVTTTNDFGTRGALPSHPELLDWLATEFVSSGWDVKALHRQIVLSATYRQSAHIAPGALEQDAANTWLARAARERLSAEAIRDNALYVSGLLSEEVGSESVRPYIPDGLFESLSSGGGGGGGFGNSRYRTDEGEQLYRRGLYVYWKRGLLYPSFAIFDAPTRQVCTSERLATNTPLQSLVLLNDVVFVEAARALGQRMLDEGGTEDAGRLALGFRLCTSRLPDERELGVLLRVLAEQRAHYAEDEEAATEFCGVGASELPEGTDVKELAAFAAIGNLLLNLDATIHKG